MMALILILWRVLRGGAGWMGGAARWLWAAPARALAVLCLILAVWGAVEHARASHAAAAAAACAQARKSDLAAAIAAQVKAENQNRSASHAAQISFQAGQAGSGHRFDAYAAGHGLRPPAKAPAPEAPQNQPAAVSDGAAGAAKLAGVSAPALDAPPADAVWVSRADWHGCDQNYDYARAAYDWARGISGDPAQ